MQRHRLHVGEVVVQPRIVGLGVSHVTGPRVHVLDGGVEPFSVVIVGYDQWDSYAYLGGTGTGKINPNPPG